MTYTIEDVIDVINEELEDAYYEASKEEADKVEDLGKKTRAYEKMAAFDTDKAGSSRPGVGFNSPKTEPKGDKETIRKKNIRKAFGGQYIHYDTGEAGKARAKMKDSQNAVSKLITGEDGPFPENYFIKDSIKDHIDMIKDRKAKKAKVAEEDCCKESVLHNIYEAYCDDVIDAETAMDMILTIESSTSEALEKLKKSGEEYNNRIKTASDELEKKKSDTLSSIRDRHEKANKEIEDMKKRIDEALSTKDEEDIAEMIRKALGK